jgi:hypothetical protein
MRLAGAKDKDKSGERRNQGRERDKDKISDDEGEKCEEMEIKKRLTDGKKNT